MAGVERPEALVAWTQLCEVVDGARTALNRELQAKADLTLAENLVLCQVAMAPDQRLRMADIAGLLTIARSAVTKTVDRLEERGLLARHRDPSGPDRRTVYATLTGAGAQVFSRAQPAFASGVERQIGEPLSERELQTLRSITDKLLRARATLDENDSGSGSVP